MKRIFAFILMMSCARLASPQEPERNVLQIYNPAEMVSFKRDVPFKTALDILNAFSQRYENRMIIDNQEHNQAIGVAVENMHWKRALEYILRSNMMKYVQHERYYEIQGGLAEAKKPEEELVTIATREVEINAIFFQADYQTLFEFGINWSTFKNGTVQINTSGASNVAQDFLRVSGGGTINGSVRVDALLRAFESRSKGEIIARPQVRVIDGQQGKIKVGKNFFLTLQDFAGNTRFTEYESGIILTVTPNVLGRNDSTFIYLDISAERSDVTPDVIGVTKNITQGNTQVLLLNGEETVLAGLLNHEVQTVRKGIPGLKDLPPWFFGLRYLFSYESKKVNKKELVIFIEAKLLPSLLKRRLTRNNAQDYFDKEWQDLKGKMPRNQKSSRPTRSNLAPTSQRLPDPNR
jgi:type IV pilus assembly protein PilQ